MPSDANAPRPAAPYQGRRVVPVSQAAVELRVPDAAAAFVDARNVVLRWLAAKAGRALPAGMRDGETGELNTIGPQRVETAALDDPRRWAARQDGQDADVPRRTWVTEAAVELRGGSRLLVGHRLHLVTSGEPAPFARSVPRFMREAARLFRASLDGAEIGLAARRAETAEEAGELADLLADKQRRHPVIGVSIDPGMIDADRLAHDVFGTAHVWAVGRAASFALGDRFGRELSVFHGGVRTWLPPLAPGDGGHDHPLTLARRIAAWGGGVGPRAFHGEFVNRALRFSALRRDAEPALPPFTETRQLAARLGRERAAAEGRGDKELLELALAENERLSRALEEQKAEHAELLELAEDEERRLRAEHAETLAQVANLRHRVAALEAALRGQRQERDTPIPESLEEIGAWAAEHLGGAVLLLPRAVNAAKKSPFEDVPLAYRTLLALRDKYVPMRRDGGPKPVAEWEAAMRELGLELSRSFKGTRAGQFGNEYFVKWKGRTEELDMHLKGSSSRDPRYGFRCYFFWDEGSRKVVVGWLPGHLTTDAT